MSEKTQKRSPKKKAGPRWFLMEPIEKEGERDHEIDDVRWLSVEEAIGALSYDADRTLVETVEAGV